MTVWPFVGRKTDIDYVETLLKAGVGALLIGEQGVGTSALARQLGARRADEGASVVHIAGRAVSSRVPYEPFAGILDGLSSAELGPADPRTVAAVLCDTWRTSASQSVLVIVDDAHLLDDASAQVLTYLAEKPAVRLILTAAAGTTLPGPVKRLWFTGTCRRVEVGGLSEADVTETLETVLDGPVGPRTVRAFATRARGNALLLRELTITAVTRDVFRLRHGVWTIEDDPPLSDGIRAVVAERLSVVDPALLVGLETIAAGEPLDIRIAHEVLGEEALEALDRARLITVSATGPATLITAVHPIYGEVLRSGMPRLRLRRLRLDLARVIEWLPGSAAHDLVRAAQWRVEAGQINDSQQLMQAARMARGFSLTTAEHLARAAYDALGSVDAALLLAEIYTHTGRGAEASAVLAGLPAESLRPEDRGAVVYCTAIAQGVLRGDLAGAAELIDGVEASVPGASNVLRAVYSAMLAFDARLRFAVEVGLPLLEDRQADAMTRTFAGLGVVCGLFWLGRTSEAIRLGETVLASSDAVRDAAPFGSPSIMLMSNCALADEGRFDEADKYAHEMRVDAAARDDPWQEPRAIYCLGRTALLRGRPTTARAALRRCIGTMPPLDRSFLRHVRALVARAAALSGDVPGATSALDLPADVPRITAYEPDWELAQAAAFAAELRMDEAFERAAWVAGVAAEHEQWGVVLTACHDAARYGGAKHVAARVDDAADRVDGELARCYVGRIRALVNHDGPALDTVSLRFQALGAMLYAAETAAEAAIAHGGLSRTARASAARFERLRTLCEDAVFAWHTPLAAAEPLTTRERQVARLAARGTSDNDIALQLGISARTAQTHLARAYVKLGVRRRGGLAPLFD